MGRPTRGQPEEPESSVGRIGTDRPAGLAHANQHDQARLVGAFGIIPIG
jgi:hypothetical protein